MVIGIDASRAAKKKRTGTENYSYYLILHLLQLPTEARFVLYTKEKLPHELRCLLSDRKLERIVKGRFLWSQGALARAARSDKLDILFVPSHIVPFLYRRKTVVTVHGLEYEKTTDGYSFLDRLYMRLTTRFGARHSKSVIVPSEHTKKDLESFYGVPQKKVSVIRHGSIAQEIEQAGASLSCFEKKRPYFFFIGRLEERKNIKRLLRAFFEIKKEIAYVNVQLILAGSKTDYFLRECSDLIESSKYASDVVARGYVSDKEYYCYLKKATALVFPSLFEGFGMPVLDAQYLGVPVVTSKNSPMEEICERKCALVAPFDIKSIKDGMKKVLDGKVYHNENGRRDALLFSWNEAAKETLDVLVEACSRK
ncbi:glycosyltransferase family 4 protein [Patescibacteria group bacterium]|nr:glycosyltransferase family 4 protein [Patescibacteria group bacterium]